jgi:hypothetical protein
MKNRVPALLLAVALVVVATMSTACVGIYDNTTNFDPAPTAGMSEGDMLKKYGAPDFSGFVDAATKVYIYEVRKTEFYFFIGFYKGHDLVVMVRDGRVVETAEAPRAKVMSILQPTPWAVTD